MNLLDTTAIIKAGGYAAIFAILFAETGVLIGFFLPGDSLLFTAGFLASVGYPNITILIMVSFIAAVLGDSFGYGLGKKFGPNVFKRKSSLLLNPDNVVKTENFYLKHGGKTIIFARFLPLIRTLAPILAGVARMKYRTFFAYNVLGAGLWAIGLSLIGYFIGKIIPHSYHYGLSIIFGIVTLSVLPIIITVIRTKLLKKST